MILLVWKRITSKLFQNLKSALSVAVSQFLLGMVLYMACAFLNLDIVLRTQMEILKNCAAHQTMSLSTW